MSVKWCAVEQKGRSEAFRRGSSYPGGLVGGSGLATWGPRRLVGPLLHTCQRERNTTPSESQGSSQSSTCKHTVYLHDLVLPQTEARWRSKEWLNQNTAHKYTHYALTQWLSSAVCLQMALDMCCAQECYFTSDKGWNIYLFFILNV